jgi:serine/threonine protein kinase
VLEAVEAIRFVHSKGIVHGDITAKCFLIRDNHTLALAGFGGLYRDPYYNEGASEELTPEDFGPPQTSEDNPYKHITAVLNTTPKSCYKPTPKLESGHTSPTEKDDIFALGTVMYLISTRKPLYTDKSDKEIRRLWAEGVYPDLKSITDATIRNAIQKCWKYEYKNAEELWRDLREFPN